MTNVIETVIVLGTVTGIVAMFVHVSNKAIKAAHDREIESIRELNRIHWNDQHNQIKKLETDINLLCGSTASDDDRKLIIKHYVNKMNMREYILNAMYK